MKHIGILAIIMIAITTGCTSPQWRLFQKEVPQPVLNVITEADRQASKLIADNIAEPVELIPVARTLSERLGPPEKPIETGDLQTDADLAISNLRREIERLNKQLEAQNRFLAKYAGNKIEDTGFNIFGPSMGILVIGLIVLGVLFPPAFTVMLFIYRRLKHTTKGIIQSIEQTADEARTLDLKQKLSKNLDHQDKVLISKLKHEL